MKPQYIMIHHSGVSYEKNEDQFYTNDNYHRAKWNFKSSMNHYLGYNYEISKLGKIRQARKDGEKTAACYQADMNNGKCIHICIDGHFDNEKPYPQQMYALRDLLRELTEKHGINKNNILFHRDYAQTNCPGNNMDIVWIKSLVSKNSIKEANKPTIDIKQKIIKIINELRDLVNKIQ